MTAKSFPLATVLTITTGRCLCPMDEVYAILNHLTGEELYTHQLPRAMQECKPWLLQWFPELYDVDTRGLDTLLKRQPPQRAVEAWLARLLCTLPASYEVLPLPHAVQVRRDPIDELSDMVGPGRAIIVMHPEKKRRHATP